MNEIIITPLGTVSPYPTKKMNCPGYLVEYHDKRILLDCGNGVLGLLEFPDILHNLSVIITHYHKDHLGDVCSLQSTYRVYNRLGYINEPIHFYLPKNDYKLNKEAILANSSPEDIYTDIVDGYSFKVDDLTITFEDNKSHTIGSFMVKLENNNHKIVYTSDIGTTNYDKLVNFCKNADLLICESSFILKHNTNSETHMTAKGAATLAKDAKVKKLLLTHFWPAEDKNNYKIEAREIFKNSVVAKEGKKIIIK